MGNAIGPAVELETAAAFIAEQTETRGAASVSRDISVLHAILRTAQREELVMSNAAAAAERPKLPRRHWRILQLHEISRVAREFTDEQMQTVFWTLVLTGVRREELRRSALGRFVCSPILDDNASARGSRRSFRGRPLPRDGSGRSNSVSSCPRRSHRTANQYRRPGSRWATTAVRSALIKCRVQASPTPANVSKT